MSAPLLSGTALTGARHVPGRWVARNWSCHAPTTVMCEAQDGGQSVIAECSGNGERYEDGVVEANAKLIAAAPDMAEALQGIISFLEAVNLAGHGQPDHPSVIAGRAALAKAGVQS